MKTFGIDENFEQVDFEQVSVEEMAIISGGSGGSNTVYCQYDGKNYSVGGTYVQDMGSYFQSYVCQADGTWARGDTSSKSG